MGIHIQGDVYPLMEKENIRRDQDVQVTLEEVSSFREFNSTPTDEIQGKHVHGTTFGEQQLGPVMHADVPPN